MFKVKGRTEPLISPQPEPPTRPLAELADEYVAFMGLYDRSRRGIWKLGDRLSKLMQKHDIRYIARKGCLLRVRGWGACFIEITPLPARLDGSVALEAAPAKHLIPLVDRFLEADGGHERDTEYRTALGAELAKAMKAVGLKSFLHKGYRFNMGYHDVCVDTVADFDG